MMRARKWPRGPRAAAALTAAALVLLLGACNDDPQVQQQGGAPVSPGEVDFPPYTPPSPEGPTTPRLDSPTPAP